MEKKPTDVLEEEHRYILKVIGALTVLGESLEKGETVEPETFKNIVEFMRIFADKRRHGKEEALLFPNPVALKQYLEAHHWSVEKR